MSQRKSYPLPRVPPHVSKHSWCLPTCAVLLATSFQAATAAIVSETFSNGGIGVIRLDNTSIEEPAGAFNQSLEDDVFSPSGTASSIYNSSSNAVVRAEAGVQELAHGTPEPAILPTDGNAEKAMEELAAELRLDGAFVADDARSDICWRCGLLFTGCMLIGSLTIGLSLGLLKPMQTDLAQYATADKEKPWACGVGFTVFTFAICMYCASVLVDGLAEDCNNLNGNVMNDILAQCGERLLHDMGTLQAQAAVGNAQTWTLEVKNPTEDEIALDTFYTEISGTVGSIAIVKLQQAPVVLPASGSNQMSLSVALRTPDAIGVNFNAVSAVDWRTAKSHFKFNTAVTGYIKDRDFDAHVQSSLPIRLLELPAHTTWPAGLRDLSKVRLSFAKGLYDAHEKNEKMLDYPSLVLSGYYIVHTHCLIAFLAGWVVVLSIFLVCCAWQLESSHAHALALAEKLEPVQEKEPERPPSPPPAPQVEPVQAPAPEPAPAPPKPQEQEAEDEHEF